MNLPPSFRQTIENTFGDRGRLFLNSLPTLIEEAAQRWQLTGLRPAPNLSYNYLAFARRRDSDVVLKLGVPDRELTSEIRSLRHFAGQGAVQLLDSDSARGMLLLERLQPGGQLTALADDAIAARIAAETMLTLRRPVPEDAGFIRLSDWLRGFQRMRDRFDGVPGPIDPKWLDRAHAAASDLLAEDSPRALIHGDLHHSNILSSERGWLAIDPKGVIGPAAYEVGPFLINPWVVVGFPSRTAALLRDRITILSETLSLEQERIRTWGIVHAVLSAVWSFEDNQDWRPAIECARILSALGS